MAASVSGGAPDCFAAGDCRRGTRQHLAAAERLAALRARAQASLADPAPTLTEAEADARLAALFAAAGAGEAV